MKIAFIVTKLSKAAPVLYVKTLVDYLLPFAIIEVFYFDNVVELQFPCITTKIKFNDKLDFDKYDILHSHGLRPDLFLWKNKKHINEAKIISTIHSYIYYDIKSQYNGFISFIFCKLWLNALNKFNNVVALTHDMKLYYEKYLNKAPISYIHSGHSLPENENPISQTEIDMITQFKSESVLIGVIANLRKQKGVNQIIDAISKNLDYSLIIIGDGNVKKDLERQAMQSNCHKRCLFLGHRPDAYKYLEFIDIYAMTSYQEGFGLVNIEAALYRKPLVCSDINVFKEIFNEECVSFFELNNTQSLLDALKKIRVNYDFFAENAFVLVTSEYSPQRMGEKYLGLYKKLMLT